MSQFLKNIFYKKQVQRSEDRILKSNKPDDYVSEDDQEWQGGIFEGMKPKNWKTLVNEKISLATFGAGCFWGTEKFFASDFAKLHPGSILGTSVGFMNPDSNAARPTNDNKSGYIEVVYILFDPSKTSFEELCLFFYTFHDPTTHNRQGSDVGVEYSSAVFYHDDDQKSIATSVRERV